MSLNLDDLSWGYRSTAQRKQAVLIKDHINVIDIIERTVHGPWTHFQSAANKRTLVRWLNLYANKWITAEEKKFINDSVTFDWVRWKPYETQITYQFLCDLVTTVLYARGMDVWEIILSTQPEGEEA